MHHIVSMPKVTRVRAVYVVRGSRLMRAASWLVCVHTIGCVRWRPDMLSSESSGYSPVARLYVSTAIHHDTLDVVVDSGYIVAPGESQPGAPVVAQDMFVYPFVARSHPLANRPVARSKSESWDQIAVADSVFFAPTIHYGERIPVSRAHFRLALPRSDKSTLWLGFTVTGSARVGFARLAGAEATPVRDRGRPFRVFVCSRENLAGTLDTTRAATLARNYMAAC